MPYILAGPGLFPGRYYIRAVTSGGGGGCLGEVRRGFPKFIIAAAPHKDIYGGASPPSSRLSLSIMQSRNKIFRGRSGVFIAEETVGGDRFTSRGRVIGALCSRKTPVLTERTLPSIYTLFSADERHFPFSSTDCCRLHPLTSFLARYIAGMYSSMQ